MVFVIQRSQNTRLALHLKLNDRRRCRSASNRLIAAEDLREGRARHVARYRASRLCRRASVGDRVALPVEAARPPRAQTRDGTVRHAATPRAPLNGVNAGTRTEEPVGSGTRRGVRQPRRAAISAELRQLRVRRSERQPRSASTHVVAVAAGSRRRRRCRRAGAARRKSRGVRLRGPELFADADFLGRGQARQAPRSPGTRRHADRLDVDVRRVGRALSDGSGTSHRFAELLALEV